MAANNFGNNTISVGSLSELAGIITNFPPEQLQNVQLDPTLYEALSKTVDSNSVQVHGGQGIGELPTVQLIQNPMLTVADGASDGSAHNATAGIIVNPTLGANNTILSSLGTEGTNTIMESHVNNAELVSTLTGNVPENAVVTNSALFSPIKTNLQAVQPSVSNYHVIQQHQPQQTAAAPILAINESGVPTVTQVVPNQTIVMQNVNVGQPSGLQGILPGEASSLILTPTLMSQVQPTATVQTINITDAQILHNAANLNSTTDSVILSPTAVQTPVQSINLSSHAPPAVGAAATLTVDEQGIIQLPAAIASNASIIPSTVTIDPNLLKSNLDAITNTTGVNTLGSIGVESPLIQNIPLQQSSTSNQCILVDGNIISGNTIVGQVITSGNLPLQQVLVTDINPNPTATTLLLNGINATTQQQPLSQLNSTVASENVNTTTVQRINKIQTVVTTTSTISRPTVTVGGVSQPKKTKTIQTISNFSPQSSVFNQVKTPKSGTPQQSGGSGKQTTPSRNVIVKKTINVIKKSESMVVPMKPTSVEQVQPGVFKFQLKKVDTSEVESLLQQETAIVSSTKLNSNYHITMPPKTSTRIDSSTTKPLKTSNTVSSISSSLLSTMRNAVTQNSSKPTSRFLTNTTVKSTATLNSPSTDPKPLSTKSSEKTNTVARQQYAPKLQPEQQAVKNITNGTSLCKSTPTSIIKSITLPKDVLSKLKAQAKGSVIKITDASVLNQLVALSSKTPEKKIASTDANSVVPISGKTPKNVIRTPSTKSNGVSNTTTPSLLPAEKSTIPKALTTKTPLALARFRKVATSKPLANTKTPIDVATSKSTAVLSTTTLRKEPSPVTSSKVLTESSPSPEKIFIPAPRNKRGVILPTLIRKNTKDDSTSSPAKIDTVKPGDTNPASAKPVAAKPVAAKPAPAKITDKTQRHGSVDSELEKPLEHNLECKERGFVSPPLDELTTKHSTLSVSDRLLCPNSPMLILNKVPRPKTPESSQDEISLDGDTSQEETEEVHNLREAIKSSRVGEQEKQMRDLARQEIENQLKRFSQQEKKAPLVDTATKTSTLEQPAVKRKKTESQAPGNSSTIITSSSITTTETTTSRGSMPAISEKNPDGNRMLKNDTPNAIKRTKNKNDAKQLKKRFKNNKSTTEVIEESRKRGRPKKYDDFVLAPKSKKEKKARKFFFPKGDRGDEEEKNDDSENKENNDSSSVANDEDVDNVVENIDEESETCNRDSESQMSQTDSKSNKSSSSGTAPSKESAVPSKSSSSNNTASKHKKPTSQEPAPKTTAKKGQQAENTKKRPSANAKTKTNKTKKKKRKQKPLAFEPEVLPEHLKTKPKAKVEDAVIDLTKVKLKSAFAETSYNLDDFVNPETCRLLSRKQWICTLCGKPGNLGSLDVLFGPYKIKVRPENNNKNSSEMSESKMNVWLHRDCAIWTSNICLSNQTLCGLGESLNEAAITKCCLCSKVGATLQCGFKQCRDGYHFVCAKQRGCSFQMENFTITCPKHR